MQTKEKNFEADIEHYPLSGGGYVKGNMATDDKACAIDMHVLMQFLEATQPNMWQKY